MESLLIRSHIATFHGNAGEKEVYEALQTLDDKYRVFYSLEQTPSAPRRTIRRIDDERWPHVRRHHILTIHSVQHIHLPHDVKGRRGRALRKARLEKSLRCTP